MPIFFFYVFQSSFLYKIYIFHKWQWKGVLSMCTHSTFQTLHWQLEKVQVEQFHSLCQSQVLLNDPIAYVCTLMLPQFSCSWNHLLALGAYNVSPLCIQEWIFELINWLSGALFVCHMFLVFIILWKGSQYLFQCHWEHHYFSFLRWKVIEVSLHAWCCWSAGNQVGFLNRIKTQKFATENISAYQRQLWQCPSLIRLLSLLSVAVSSA